MLFVTLVTIALLLFASYYWSNRKLPPGPWGLPFLGYLPFLDPRNPQVSLTNLSKKYGAIYGLRMGSVYTVVLTDPKIIKAVFSKDSTTGRAPLYLTHGIMEGWGLICTEGEIWKDQRKFVFNCLRKLGAARSGQSKGKLEGMIMEHVTEFIKCIQNMGEIVTIDPLDQLRHSLGSIVNMIVCGKTWDKDDETWKWLLQVQEDGTQMIGIAGPLNFLPILRFLPKFKNTMKFLIEGKYKQHGLYKKLIAAQKEKLTLGGDNSSNVIREFLLEKENKNPEVQERFYNDKQFHHLLADLFGAGLDTTMTTVRWYFLYIAKHQAVQAKIKNEIREVLQGRQPSLQDITYLPLVEASICEVQRIRSVVPVGIPHGTVTDIEIGGYLIPKGTMLVPLQWAIHMNEEVWAEPEKFDPGRFLDDNGQIKRNEYFIPFQVGKRMCVGDELAKSMMFLFVVTTLQNFTISLEDENVDLSGECGITLTPKHHRLVFSKER